MRSPVLGDAGRSGQAGGAAPDAARPVALSPRQAEVMARVDRGWTYKQIIRDPKVSSIV